MATASKTGGGRIPVAVLGATGSVGQRFVELLEDHPWFELRALAASPRNEGRRYAEAVRWMQARPLGAAGELTLRAADPGGIEVAPWREGGASAPGEPVRIVFSALDAAVAGPVETAFADAGALVVSNAKSHRMDADVPLLVPEANPGHLALLERQGHPGGGAIVANPNCSTAGLVLALAPLHRAFGVRRVHVVTLQALSGAGIPGVSSMQIVDNLVPFIPGEEEKLATEPRKILGELGPDGVEPAPITVSAQCNRVAVLDGHTECVSMELGRDATAEEIRAVWAGFTDAPQSRGLPSAPSRPTLYLEDEDAPQPRRHRDVDGGMAAVIGRLRECPVLGWRFVVLSHNTLRGAAGGAILSAELAVAREGVAPR